MCIPLAETAERHWTAAPGSSGGELLHPGISVKRQLLPVNPAETKRLVESLGIGDRWNTRILLENPDE